MLLNNHSSLCAERASVIISKDKKNPQRHVAHNKDGNSVDQYQIDGVVVVNSTSCDFLVRNRDKQNAYLIELKGSDLVKAASQLEATARVLKDDLNDYTVYLRIIANKCKTHAITSTEYKKFKMRWGNRLVQKTACYEENI